MDPFAAIMLGGVALLLVVLLLLGRFYPGSGAQQLDWRPTRSPELEVQNEIDDVDQMREAVNRRRRARGEAELTEATCARRWPRTRPRRCGCARASRERHVRAVMVGGGCRGLRLARTLVAEGNAVRAVTRRPARRVRRSRRRLRVLDRRSRPHRHAALRGGQRHDPALAAGHRDSGAAPPACTARACG